MSKSNDCILIVFVVNLLLWCGINEKLFTYLSKGLIHKSSHAKRSRWLKIKNLWKNFSLKLVSK